MHAAYKSVNKRLACFESTTTTTKTESRCTRSARKQIHHFLQPFGTECVDGGRGLSLCVILQATMLINGYLQAGSLGLQACP